MCMQSDTISAESPLTGIELKFRDSDIEVLQQRIKRLEEEMAWLLNAYNVKAKKDRGEST